MAVYRTDDLMETLKITKECLAGSDGLIIFMAKEPSVITGKLHTFDLDYCRKHNIPVAYGEYLGGSIVSFPGDVLIESIHWGSTDFAPNAIIAVEQWLIKQGLDAVRNNNDLLLDGKKVASWARAMTLQGWCQSGVHFSFGTDVELIRAICTKPMEKEPGSLASYGISAVDILRLLGLAE